VQPLRRQERKTGELLVELRCPECYVVMQACHTVAEIEELDRRQTASRDQIVAAYERAVVENMETLAENLHEALERDLVSADDFAIPPLRRRRPGDPDVLPRAA
jgi:threonine synthase